MLCFTEGLFVLHTKDLMMTYTKIRNNTYGKTHYILHTKGITNATVQHETHVNNTRANSKDKRAKANKKERLTYG